MDSKNNMSIMNDTNLNGKKEMALGNYIVNKGIVNEKLRDEIYCQICNRIKSISKHKPHLHNKCAKHTFMHTYTYEYHRIPYLNTDAHISYTHTYKNIHTTHTYAPR